MLDSKQQNADFQEEEMQISVSDSLMDMAQTRAVEMLENQLDFLPVPFGKTKDFFAVTTIRGRISLLKMIEVDGVSVYFGQVISVD